MASIPVPRFCAAFARCGERCLRASRWGRDFDSRQPVVLEPQDVAVRRRAQVEHPAPNLVGEDRLGQGAGRPSSEPHRSRRPSAVAVEGATMATQPVDEAIPLRRVRKARKWAASAKRQPLAEALQQMHPDRLHDIHRVEFGPQLRRQLPSHHHPQVRLVGAKRLFGRGVTRVESGQQRLDGCGTQGNSSAKAMRLRSRRAAA